MADAHTATPHPALVHHFEGLEQQKEAASLGMWVFIAQEVMFFGGLFLMYAVYRSLYPRAFAEASHHLNVAMGTVNTVVLITSSLTMAMAVHAAALHPPNRLSAADTFAGSGSAPGARPTSPAR